MHGSVMHVAVIRERNIGMKFQSAFAEAAKDANLLVVGKQFHWAALIHIVLELGRPAQVQIRQVSGLARQAFCVRHRRSGLEGNPYPGQRARLPRALSEETSDRARWGILRW